MSAHLNYTRVYALPPWKPQSLCNTMEMKGKKEVDYIIIVIVPEWMSAQLSLGADSFFPQIKYYE